MKSLLSVRVRVAFVAVLVVVASCGTDEGPIELQGSASEPRSEIDEGWGPLAVVVGDGSGDAALIQGSLEVSERCVLLDERGELALLVWPDRNTEWDEETGKVRYTNSDGSVISLGDGDTVSFGGGGSSVDEGGVSAEEFLASVDWVAEPEPDCVAATRWFIGDVADAAEQTGDDSSGEVPAACLPDDDVVASGQPQAGRDMRIEDIVEFLTGERQTSDEDPVEETIDDPNFGGVWGDFQGGVVVAVIDCSKVDASELARLAGGPEFLHLIEVPHTFNQVSGFRDVLVQELDDLGVQGQVQIDSTLSGRLVNVGVLDPDVLPENFGSTVPADAFSVSQIETLDGEE